MPQVQAPRRNTAPLLLLLLHVSRTLTQMASSLLTLLWQSMKWIFVFIIVAVVASVLASLVYTYLTTGSVTFVNVQTFSIIQTIQTHVLLTLVLCALVIVLVFLSFLASRKEQHARQQNELSEYSLRPIHRLDPSNYKLFRYVKDAYISRQADHTARQLLRELATTRLAHQHHTVLGICVFGRPTQGKTRLAWEAIQAELPTWMLVRWPHEREHGFDFAAQHGQRIVLWLDDLHEYAHLNEAPTVSDLPRRFDEAQAQLIIVATCRDGEDKTQAQKHLSTLLERLTEIRLPDISLEEASQLVETLTREGVQVRSEEFDGTPGSLLLGVQRMRDRYLHLPLSAQCILKTLKLLHSANIYTYFESRVRSVGSIFFRFNEQEWREACDLLDQEHFVRKRISAQGEQLLEPIADVYLEQAVEGYPTPSADIADDWPQLENCLMQRQDAPALLSLGIAFAERRHGNLRSNKTHAEVCFRAALEVYTRDSSPAAWARTQNNLGNALRDQAALAEGAKRLELLRQAELAYRAALQVRTRESSPAAWAMTQFNLAYLNLVRVSLQHDTPEGDTVVTCAYLREAAQSIENTLSVYTPEAHPADHLRATKLQEMIEEALQASHCCSEPEEQQ